MIWLAFFLAWPGAGQAAAEKPVLSPASLEASILENFPLVEEAVLRAEAAQAELTAAKGAFDIKLKVDSANRFDDKYNYRYLKSSLEKQFGATGLNLFAGHLRSTGEIPPYTGKYATSPSGEAFAGASLPLLRGQGINEAFLEEKNAELGVEQKRQELLLKKNTYLHKGLSAFLKWRLAHGKYAAREALLKLSADRQSMLESRVRAGDVERIRLVDNQRSVNKRQEELLEAELALEAARLELALFYRDETGKPRPLLALRPDEGPMPSATKLSQPELKALPRLGLIDTELSLTAQAEAFGRNQRLPSLGVSAVGYRRLAPGPDLDRSRLELGLQLEIPLENRKGTGKEAAARAKGYALEKERSYFLEEFAQRLEQMKAAIRISSERVKVIGQELTSAREMAQAERKRWQRGDSELFVVALREQDAADVEIKLLTASYDLEQANLDARLLTADLLP